MILTIANGSIPVELEAHFTAQLRLTDVVARAVGASLKGSAKSRIQLALVDVYAWKRRFRKTIGVAEIIRVIRKNLLFVSRHICVIKKYCKK